jgi:hypothetical protein
LIAEKEAVKELLKEQYIYLTEMDELAREKLFILQVLLKRSNARVEEAMMGCFLLYRSQLPMAGPWPKL